jgi:uncharacterized protein
LPAYDAGRCATRDSHGTRMTLYDLVMSLQQSLKNLDAVVGKAEAYAEAHGIKPEVLIQGRLRPDMLPFVAQIRIATDTAKGAAARLTGSELPKWADDEASFAEVHERLNKAIDYLGTFEAGQFDGAETRDIELKFGPRNMHFSGQDYVTRFVLPNFYFHVSIAYAILRYSGLDIGKADYLGG